MYENNQIPKEIPHKLFVLKVPADPDKHEYDVVLSNGTINGKPIIPNDSELCIFLYEIIYINSKPGFNIHACLDYHYSFAEDKEYFLEVVQDGLIMQHASYEASTYDEYRHKKVLAWFDIKAKGPLYVYSNLPDRVSHKILLLKELGIIEHLKSRYFSLSQNERSDTDFARLLAIILNEVDSTETIRKAILAIGTGKNADPATGPGIKKVKVAI